MNDEHAMNKYDKRDLCVCDHAWINHAHGGECREQLCRCQVFIAAPKRHGSRFRPMRFWGRRA